MTHFKDNIYFRPLASILIHFHLSRFSFEKIESLSFVSNEDIKEKIGGTKVLLRHRCRRIPNIAPLCLSFGLSHSHSLSLSPSYLFLSHLIASSLLSPSHSFSFYALIPSFVTLSLSLSLCHSLSLPLSPSLSLSLFLLLLRGNETEEKVTVDVWSSVSCFQHLPPGSLTSRRLFSCAAFLWRFCDKNVHLKSVSDQIRGSIRFKHLLNGCTYHR